MQSNKLNQIRAKVEGKGGGKTATFDTIIYQLAKELGCLGDLIGREYEFIKKDGEIVGFRQKRIQTRKLMSLLSEALDDADRQEKLSKKGRKKGRKR